jgi:hypothetical protein
LSVLDPIFGRPKNAIISRCVEDTKLKPSQIDFFRPVTKENTPTLGMLGATHAEIFSIFLSHANFRFRKRNPFGKIAKIRAASRVIIFVRT